MASTMHVVIMLFSVPYTISSSRIIHFVLENIESAESIESFHFDCVRRCLRSKDCAASHVSRDECYSLDLTQYKSLAGLVYTGVLYKKVQMECVLCKNGGYFANSDATQCTCPKDFAGTFCERHIEDCSEAYEKGTRQNGIYTIQPRASSSPFHVYCLMQFGGRTYVQKQETGINFIRTWTEYKTGFGNVTEDHWLGLDKIKDVASDGMSRLVIHIKTPYDFKQCNYRNFTLKGESDGYSITYVKYATTTYPLADCLEDLRSSRFSTWDKDNDGWDAGSCAIVHQSGWWFNNCTKCNPNGILKPSVGTPNSETVYWHEDQAVKIYMSLSRK